MANGSGRGLTGRQHRPDSAHAPFAGGTPRRGPEQGREAKRRFRSPLRSGGIEHCQQLLQHCSHCRPAPRLVHCLEDPRCDAGRDLLQVDLAVHQQLGADFGGCQRHGKGATGFRVHRGGQQGQPSGQGHNQRHPLLIAQRIPASL